MWRLIPKKISEFTGAGSLDGTELVPIVKGGANDTATTAEIAALASGPAGGGAVDSVNGQTGAVALTQNDIPDGTTAKQYTQTEKTKLAGVATAATANDTDANLKNRANHTGTQPASTISDFSAAADARVAAAGGVSIASLSGGKVPSSQLPAVSLTSVQTAATQSAMLALTTQEGDVVVRTDENKTYMRNAGTSGTMTDFTLLNTPTDAVTSVNGQSGAVVLDAADVGAATPSDVAAKQDQDAILTALAALVDAAGVLTNDGGGNLSWEPAGGGGGGGATRLTWSTMFENITRFDSTSGGTSASAPQINSGGVYFDTGSTNTGYGWIGLSLPFAAGLPIWDLNPHMLFGCNWPGTASSWESYTTIGPSGRPDSPIPNTNTQYAGFHIVRSAGVGAVYAVHSDGVNPEVATDITSTALAAVVAGSNAAMEVRVTSGTKIDFYVNGALVATHTTNLPSGHNTGYDRFWDLSLKASGVGAAPWAYVSADALVISCDEAA
jgi:hypothetical protein